MPFKIFYTAEGGSYVTDLDSGDTEFDTLDDAEKHRRFFAYDYENVCMSDFEIHDTAAGIAYCLTKVGDAEDFVVHTRPLAA